MNWKDLIQGLKISSPPTLYQCEPGWSWINPCFADFDLWIVLGGEGWVESARKKNEVRRGDSYLFRPGDSLRAGHRPDRPLRVFAVHFILPRAAAAELCRLVPRAFFYHDPAGCELAALEILESAREKDTAQELRLALLLARAARDAGRKVSGEVEEKLRRLFVEIGANPAVDWDPQSMARKVSLSLPQFNRRFRSFTGLSPTRYVIQRKVDRARRLLSETPMSLQEIAENLGYRDIYYFHRQFRMETGTTPARFRKKLLRGLKEEGELTAKGPKKIKMVK